MNRFDNNSLFTVASDGKLWARIGRSGSALLALLCLALVPSSAKAACGNFGAPGIKAVIKMPSLPHADLDDAFNNPTIVGLWHVMYTNSSDQSLFNDTFDTWHSDGTEFESAFLAPAGGDVCAGAYKATGKRSYVNHHVGWLFNPSTPTATATNYFTLDEQVTVAPNGKSYSGQFTFKIWNLDGTPTPAVVTGTMEATRITAD
jgi:hypothetical protein